jgi:hypothetical protein
MCLVGKRKFVKCTCCNARHTEPAGGKEVEGVVHPLLDWLHDTVVQCDDCGVDAPQSMLMSTSTAKSLPFDDSADEEERGDSFRVINLASIALVSTGNALHLRAPRGGTKAMAVELFLAARLASLTLQKEVLLDERARMLLRLEVAVISGFMASLCIASNAWTSRHPTAALQPKADKAPTKKKSRPAKVKPARVRPVKVQEAPVVEAPPPPKKDGCSHVSCRLARQLSDMDDSQFEGLLTGLLPTAPTSAHRISCGRDAPVAVRS